MFSRMVGHAVEDGRQVDLDHLAPAVQRHLAHGVVLALMPALLQATSSFPKYGLLDQGAARFRIAHVGAPEERLAAGLLDLAHDLLSLLLVQVGNDHTGPFAGVCQRRRPAYPRGGTCDDRDLVIEQSSSSEGSWAPPSGSPSTSR